MTKQYWSDAQTKNCVWLYQVKMRGHSEEYGCMCDLDENDEDLEGCTCFVEYWETHSVFLTSKEALEYVTKTSSSPNWRIYRVPCCGSMAEIIARGRKEEDGPVAS